MKAFLFTTANCTVVNPDHTVHDGSSLCPDDMCPVNTTLIYQCTIGNLLGAAVVTCTEQARWYPPVGTCVMPGEHSLS